MKTRIKAATGIRNKEEFLAMIDAIATQSVLLRTAEAMRDEEIQAVRKRYEREIASHADVIKSFAIAAEKYASENRDELFPTAWKTDETTLAKFGFRFGNPTLKLLSRKFTWESVLASVRSFFGPQTEYIRTIEELDKERLKAGVSSELLRDLGLQVTQSESFFIEPKEKSQFPA